MTLRQLARTAGRPTTLSGLDLTTRPTRALATYTTRSHHQSLPTTTSSRCPAKHHYSTATPNSAPQESPEVADFISKGSDETFVLEGLKSLTTDGQWTQTIDSPGLERTFAFKGFKGCWEFMDAVATECKRHRHHPKWTNIYNQVHITWTTHSPRGLSEKDIAMARICDQKAKEMGEVKVEGNPDVRA